MGALPKAAIAAALGLIGALWAGSASAGRLIGYEFGISARRDPHQPEREDALPHPRFAHGHRLSGRRRQARQRVERVCPGRGQVHRAGLVAARFGEARSSGLAGRHSGRIAAQSDGRARHHARSRRNRHPRHDPGDAGLNRRGGVLWLHSHVQRRRHRPFRPRRGRRAGDDDALALIAQCRR